MAACRTVHIWSRYSKLPQELARIAPAINIVNIDVNEPVQKLQEATILIADHGAVQPVLQKLGRKLKWLQLTMVGAEGILKQLAEGFTPHFTVTHMSGVCHAAPMAEYVLGHIIAREQQFFRVKEYQRNHVWDNKFRWDLVWEAKCISELSLGILGLGNIGSHVARVCKGLGMTVWGVGRRERQQIPDYIDHYRTMSSLPEVLQSCDYVCNVLPSTPDTRNLLSRDVLRNCKNKKSVFINIGRGDIIDEKSLVRALKQNWISGAILDVFESEPLSACSELWDMPQVTVSPHCSGLGDQKEMAKVIARNLELFETGKPLDFVVEKSSES